MVNLYFKHLLINIKAQLEYKISFIFNFISQFFLFFGLYFMIIGLFNKFNNVDGFNVYEILLCFSVINFGFSMIETFFRGIDKFEDYIIDGSFDRFLLRPQGIIFQVISDKIDLVKISRVIQSIIILIISLINIDIEFTFDKILVIIFMLIGSIFIFMGLFIIAAAYCFFHVHGLEIKNLLTDGGKHMAQYPIGIFSRGVKFIFTFIIPFAAVNYYPLLYLLGDNNKLYLLSPILVIVFFLISLKLFNYGLKKYASTGS